MNHFNIRRKTRVKFYFTQSLQGVKQKRQEIMSLIEVPGKEDVDEKVEILTELDPLHPLGPMDRIGGVLIDMRVDPPPPLDLLLKIEMVGEEVKTDKGRGVIAEEDRTGETDQVAKEGTETKREEEATVVMDRDLVGIVERGAHRSGGLGTTAGRIAGPGVGRGDT